MKIVITGTAYPYRGGLAAYNERLARQLHDEGHEVQIITFKLQYPGFLFPGKSQFLDGPPPDDLNIERRINSINPLNWISVGLRIKATKPDILIIKYWLPFMSPCFGTITRIVRSNHHTKVISIFDNVIPHEKHFSDRLLTKYFITSIDGAITMSQSVQDDLSSFRGDIPSRLNPHPLFDNFGLPADRKVALEKLGLDPDIHYLLFFGFIRRYKGLDLLIRSFADERLRNTGLKLLVAGEFYEDDRFYKNIVGEYNLEKEIIFFDRFINDSEVRYFFSSADLVVQPYRDATQSGVTQIAYHFEKPMVVTDVGGLREIVADGQCGYVVNPDPQAIADAIADYFNNDRKDTFTTNIKKEKEKFSWSRMTGSLMDVYNNTLRYDNKK
jgi:D-inositol-3-phosphate glycosyltransferase